MLFLCPECVWKNVGTIMTCNETGMMGVGGRRSDLGKGRQGFQFQTSTLDTKTPKQKQLSQKQISILYIIFHRLTVV